VANVRLDLRPVTCAASAPDSTGVLAIAVVVSLAVSARRAGARPAAAT